MEPYQYIAFDPKTGWYRDGVIMAEDIEQAEHNARQTINVVHWHGRHEYEFRICRWGLLWDYNEAMKVG